MGSEVCPMTGRGRIARTVAYSGGLMALACLLGAAQAKAQGGTGTTVRKTAESFNGIAWAVADDSTASGRAAPAINLRTGADAEAAGKFDPARLNSMLAEATFSGRGFEVFKAAPATPYYIPGRTKRVSLWVRTPTKQAWTLSFRDGWGRTEVAGRKLEWTITRGGEDAWKQVTFDVPGDWVQPLAFDGVVTHNWESRTTKATARLLLDQIEVEYDLADADPATGALKTWQAPPAGAPGVNAQNPPKAAPPSPLRSVTATAARPLSGADPHN
ncbi:MAG TPA: hypothetical protein VM490_08045, partial [Armatimonadaceae bacterium]|nr:hypothetical protein [Armatimonadaceae bacterium]